MTFVLQEAMERARRRARELRPGRPLPGRPPLRAALEGRGELSLVAEFKRRSPSAGDLASGRSPSATARAYRSGGAAAISVLTEPTYFGGRYADLESVRGAVALPLLMKDFVADPRQVLHAASMGASGVLLILRCLDDGRLEDLLAACAETEVEPLVECADREDLERALERTGVLVGINNRDLTTLRVDRARVSRLAPHVPEHRVLVAESGYSEPEQLEPLRGLVDAVLVGTALMGGLDPRSLSPGSSR